MRLALVAVAVLLGAAGCSSSKHDTVGTGNTIPDNVTSDATSGSCPFNGSTQPQSQPGSGEETALTKATPSTAGCIDNVQLNFSPSLAASKTAYKTTTSAAGAVLVITLENTTLGGGIKAGSSTNTHGLNYVKSVDVASSSTGVTISVTLDKERPFLVNSSNVPAELIVAIG